jgi:hypothetical protein
MEQGKAEPFIAGILGMSDPQALVDLPASLADQDFSGKATPASLLINNATGKVAIVGSPGEGDSRPLRCTDSIALKHRDRLMEFVSRGGKVLP